MLNITAIAAVSSLFMLGSLSGTPDPGSQESSHIAPARLADAGELDAGQDQSPEAKERRAHSKLKRAAKRAKRAKKIKEIKRLRRALRAVKRGGTDADRPSAADRKRSGEVRGQDDARRAGRSPENASDKGKGKAKLKGKRMANGHGDSKRKVAGSRARGTKPDKGERGRSAAAHRAAPGNAYAYGHAKKHPGKGKGPSGRR